MNQEKNEIRKFVMVQLSEPTDEDSEARKGGFDTVADIGKERIRRVIKQIDNEQDNQGELEFEGEGSELDLGFKVFKLQSSNFKVWNAPDIDTPAKELEEQLDVFADHITPEAEQESILFELILKSGYPLTTPVSKNESIARCAMLLW